MQAVHREGAPLRGQGVKRLAGAGHLFLAQPVPQGYVRHVREGSRAGTEQLNQLLVNLLDLGLARIQVQVLHLGDRAEGVHRTPARLKTRRVQRLAELRGVHRSQQRFSQLR